MILAKSEPHPRYGIVAFTGNNSEDELAIYELRNLTMPIWQYFGLLLCNINMGILIPPSLVWIKVACFFLLLTP